MRNVSPQLRALWRSLAEAEGDQPGFDYDRGYLTGWHDQYRGIKRRRPDGGYRDSRRREEFRLGYRHGREDGARHPSFPDWWPDFARGKASDVNAAIAVEQEASDREHLGRRNGPRAASDPGADPKALSPRESEEEVR